MSAVLPRLLIVDDDQEVLDLIELYLYKKFEIITAMNGFEAIDKIEQNPPAIVITDIKMPVMDGIKLLNTLKKNPATQHLPVVAITSFLEEHTTKSLCNMGFIEVITKPPENKAVVDCIEKTLASKDTVKKQPTNK